MSQFERNTFLLVLQGKTPMVQVTFTALVTHSKGTANDAQAEVIWVFSNQMKGKRCPLGTQASDECLETFSISSKFELKSR